MRSPAALLLLLALAGCSKSCGPDRSWTFVELEGVRCGRSEHFGIGINPGTNPKRLLFFLLGGGACFDAVTCDRRCNATKQLCAANLDGFSRAQWERESRSLPGTIFDRDEPANPFREDSWVFVPYCTGDFFSGGRRAEYGVDHHGYALIDKVLENIVPRFSGVEQVVMYGVSAGGFGTVFNYEQLREAFPPSVRIDLLDDSGPMFSRAWTPVQEEMSRSWGTAQNVPKNCPECAENWEKYLPYLAKKYPQGRFALASYADDEVIAHGFGGPLLDPPAFSRALDALRTEVIAPLPNAKYFVLPGRGHVLGKEKMTTLVAGGLTYAEFLRRLVEGDPAWSNVP